MKKEDTDFRQKLVELQGNMFQFAYQLTSDKEQANDLLQETTLKILTNEDKYTENTNFRAWVLTIMKNIFINNYRQEVRHSTVVDKSENLYQLNLCQESGLDTPEGSYSMKEITEAISHITDEFRIPFNMFVSGYKYTEIAEKMNIPVGTVKSRVFHVRKKLQDELKDFRR